MAVAWAAFKNFATRQAKKGERFRFTDFLAPLEVDEPSDEDKDAAVLRTLKGLYG